MPSRPTLLSSRRPRPQGWQPPGQSSELFSLKEPSPTLKPTKSTNTSLSPFYKDVGELTNRQTDKDSKSAHAVGLSSITVVGVKSFGRCSLSCLELSSEFLWTCPP